MTNQLRIRVAEAMGEKPKRRWRVFYDKDRQHGSMGLFTRDDALENVAKVIAGDLRCGFVNGDCSEPEEYDEWDDCSRFDTDANAALLLVARLKEQGWSVKISEFGDGYDCQFFKGTRGAPDWRSVYRTADTILIAICEAFLRVKATQGETKL